MKKCPYCAEEILDDAVKCKHCGSDLANQPTTSGMPTCQLCGGELRKSSEPKSRGMGCLLMLVSVFLLFLFPIGTIIGIVVFAIGVHHAMSRRGLWVCKKCGHQSERRIGATKTQQSV